MSENTSWKPGRGKLGLLKPLMGHWIAEADSPMGPLVCTRHFAYTLGGTFIEMRVNWTFETKSYEETALFGIKDDAPTFWSFTSDGKQSQGTLSDGTDVHPQAICFEAQMPAGIARMIYWPGEEGTLNWAVESKTQKGWNRFTEHRYKRKPEP
ncbi:MULTISPECIES: hypothetical protein [unclassified Flavobacterium]|uniref:hypothetical protein n=1 Tax=unclassified Flavobacterium TaxID=196869 RepID=UPI001F1441E4|nr:MULTISPECIES: hypothetical protein [unclassified Flavobacterium]UMY64483.1 hypothetical protein MKO97_08160 [Flavobacterium sp. HJ-32-4]